MASGTAYIVVFWARELPCSQVGTDLSGVCTPFWGFEPVIRCCLPTPGTLGALLSGAVIMLKDPPRGTICLYKLSTFVVVGLGMLCQGAGKLPHNSGHGK